ncbi:hypothetical protein KY284_001175 [Solanum tuberosum]|nr:hypothetical protein KY284_001175 [Solanum tuberosum]
MKSDEFGVELSGDIEDTLDVMNSGLVHFKQRTVLHGRRHRVGLTCSFKAISVVVLEEKKLGYFT